MKTDRFSMETFTESAEGRAILQTAHANDAWHIVQRLAPANSSESKEGAYLILLLDWPNGMIVRMVFNSKEVNNFTAALTTLKDMTVLDAFDTEGATEQ